MRPGQQNNATSDWPKRGDALYTVSKEKDDNNPVGLKAFRNGIEKMNPIRSHTGWDARTERLIERPTLALRFFLELCRNEADERINLPYS